MDQLFSITEDSSVKIDEQLYQFRRLGKFLELEWEELLVSSFNIELPPTQLKDNSLNIQPTENTSRDESIDNQTGNISCQVYSIIEQMKISDEEFNFVENVIKELKKLLNTILQQNCVVGMYRNNFLQLQNHPISSQYLIFMYMSNGKL